MVPQMGRSAAAASRVCEDYGVTAYRVPSGRAVSVIKSEASQMQVLNRTLPIDE